MNEDWCPTCGKVLPRDLSRPPRNAYEYVYEKWAREEWLRHNHLNGGETVTDQIQPDMTVETLLTGMRIRDVKYTQQGLKLSGVDKCSRKCVIEVVATDKGARWRISTTVTATPERIVTTPWFEIKQGATNIMPNPSTPITKETPWFDSRTGHYVADAILPVRQFMVSLLGGEFFMVEAQKWEMMPGGEVHFFQGGHLICVVASGQWRYVQKEGEGNNV